MPQKQMVKFLREHSSKSEHPLPGKGVLVDYKGHKPGFFDPSGALKIREVEVPLQRKTWSPPKASDQKRTSRGPGYCAAIYFSCESPSAQDLEMSIDEFAYATYYESQQKDHFDGTEEEGYYGTCLVSLMNELGHKRFFDQMFWIKDIETLKYRLLYEGPAIVVAPWFSEMTRIDPNGFARPNGIFEGYHSWVVYGVDDQWENFFAINSWGRDYGKDGKFLVKYSDMKRILENGFAVATR